MKSIAIILIGLFIMAACEEEIKPKDLPEPIKQAISSKYPDYKIKEAEKTEVAGKVVYEVELEKNGQELDVLFNAKGEVIEGKDENGKGEKGEKDEKDDGDEKDD